MKFDEDKEQKEYEILRDLNSRLNDFNEDNQKKKMMMMEDRIKIN